MIYPPSDFVAVTIPSDDGRGCGIEHRRPADENGRPVQPWALSCDAGCEQWLLANDQRWTSNVSDIAATYDERRELERWETVGAREKDAALTAALMQLAGFSPSQVPASVQRMIAGLQPHVPLTGTMVCPAGHGQAAGARYCSECGAPMGATVPAAAITSGPPA
jgi:hypothetical protein